MDFEFDTPERTLEHLIEMENQGDELMWQVAEGFEMLKECLIPNCSHLGMQGEFAGGIGTRLGNHLCRVGKWSARCERTFRGIARRTLYKD